jgi:hypothetical protein
MYAAIGQLFWLPVMAHAISAARLSVASTVAFFP